ncbi:helix-turn-helix domain-containing protein [Streptococcus caviae]|uniref:helix-turn-helix domain-containing protein n=1 Tax=Streptococcus sp. 'caviae' TaxID=1915004 RepID=UPI00094BB5B1|nr:helix-turn-helix transcriptional regulator [Streptococcus sp. 'caviae']OLN82538.1 hypothetical protein BMI76_08720 [Streptococcus sp. 'caviae']
MLITIVSHNIRYFRTQRNLSQEKLAELSQLHRTYISDLEMGNRNPSIKTLEKIASALKIAPYKLLKEIGDSDG